MQSGDASVSEHPSRLKNAIVVATKRCHHSWHNRKGIIAMKNFHLPLPEHTYSNLRAEAERMQVPATTLAREAVDCWLREQFRKNRREAIAAYAAEMAGTNLDLDSDLESAGVEHLVKTGKGR
jgi:hypothetical protein